MFTSCTLTDVTTEKNETRTRKCTKEPIVSFIQDSYFHLNRVQNRTLHKKTADTRFHIQ